VENLVIGGYVPSVEENMKLGSISGLTSLHYSLELCKYQHWDYISRLALRLSQLGSPKRHHAKSP
jgi:hypothetical protein